MQTMPRGTTDERLNALEGKVEDGFGQVDQRFLEVDPALRPGRRRFCSNRRTV
jgi:hypothetical protein